VCTHGIKNIHSIERKNKEESKGEEPPLKSQKSMYSRKNKTLIFADNNLFAYLEDAITPEPSAHVPSKLNAARHGTIPSVPSTLSDSDSGSDVFMNPSRSIR
jgi:hypothetical protein